MNSTRRNCGRHYSSREEMITERLRKLEEITNYPVIQENGQRICGPPTGWMKPVPNNGSEIFIGKLPPSLLEDELFKIFSKVGQIYQIRLMVHFSGYNKGFGFVTYENVEQAKMAVEQFNGYPVRPNHKIGVCKSVDNRRLYIGGIMEDKTKDEIKKAIECYVDELKDIIVYSPHAQNQQAHNRGYVFAEFATHRDAALARKLLSSGVKLWMNSPSPLRVKILYVRNLPYQITKQQLHFYLVQHVRLGNITRVRKQKCYAFIHFQHRNAAQMALSILNGLTAWGRKMEVTWSRPQIYSKENRLNHAADNFCRSVPAKMRRCVQMLKDGVPPGWFKPSTSGAPSL
ncbi:hypothetical protein ILUMI_01718 [Ignelater luminosus]|uniref:RRM domain-containing protein n=1 Tax=Ignelater luminosus TaxID=2038154 RepID=A0A8K0DJ37_IGNLU|nr:hypothetical protein ILUMI_01718 [Ignelater luminosus]